MGVTTAGRPAISAHHGGNEPGVRITTIGGYERGLASGADYVEMDIRRLADGTLVCHHDDRAGRAGPPLARLSYRELCVATGHAVPMVSDVLDMIAGRAAGHLDLKEAGYEKEVIGLAIDILGASDFMVTSLEDVSIATISRQFPRVHAALSLGRDSTGIPPLRRPGTRIGELFPLRRVRACGARSVAAHYRLLGCGVLRQCARHGIGAMAWTVDDDRLIDRFLRDGRVDVLITNRPGYAVRSRATHLGEGDRTA